MSGPFPGMDPYLESHWLDVHTSLVSTARDALNRTLPNDLVASAEERVAIESDDTGVNAYLPDLRIVEPTTTPWTTQPSGAAPTAKVDAPFRLLAQIDPITERFIRIIEAASERLITVLEFVSPTNKRGEGLRAFRTKRAELLTSGINFVEIDLVRSGDWPALLRPHVCPRDGISCYRVTVRLAGDPAAVYLYPLHLKQPLPSIPIPLRPNDVEVRLDLQSLVEGAYVNGRYDRRLDYSKPPDPPLSGDEAAWTEKLLSAAGRR